MMIETKLEGILTKKNICLKFKEAPTDGIFFVFPDNSQIEAKTNNIVSAVRNTVLGNANNRICFVEHLLAAISLLGLSKMQIFVNESEIPLGDGSAAPWLKALANWPFKEDLEPVYELPQNLYLQDEEGRTIIAYPNCELKLTYLFESPIDKNKTWTTWTLKEGIEKLGQARTFASAQEHEMLGLRGKMLSYDENGFDLELYSPDEPALHKLLDLLGDLSLAGFNPLRLKAHFISLKGGHALNTRMASLLEKTICHVHHS
jgi:UDP-3-O-[3-hydroxymyristoyl] N-acetylglucosamine deacetylase